MADIAEREGFGIVKTLVGHGIGEFFHGVPQAAAAGVLRVVSVGGECYLKSQFRGGGASDLDGVFCTELCKPA